MYACVCVCGYATHVYGHEAVYSEGVARRVSCGGGGACVTADCTSSACASQVCVHTVHNQR